MTQAQPLPPADAAASLQRRPGSVRVAGVELPWPAVSQSDRTERRLRTLGHVALVAGVLLPLCGLLPEVLHLTPDLNDGAFHLGVTRNTIAAIQERVDPLDFWVPTWLSGFPLFHYYQPGPYLLLALLHVLLPQAISLLLLYRCVTIAAVALFPLANYAALRWLRLPRESAGWAAFLSCLIAAHATYGIEMESFTWSGWGLFAQALALPLLPLALAGGWRATADGGKTLGYAALLAAAFLTHILYGYIAALSLALVPFMALRAAGLQRAWAGVLRFYAQSLALIAFFVVPLMLHLPYHAKSLYDEAAKFDSYGAAVILNRLFSGTLLDNGRLPVLTCLTAAGLYLCARAWLGRRSAVHGWLGCGFLLWVLLYFGRPTWGVLIDLLPMSHGLHLERLSSGVHIFALWLASVALGRLSRWCLGFASSLVRGALAVGLCLLLLVPMLAERIRYFVHNAAQVAVGARAFDREKADFEPVLRMLRERPGRVYAGHSGNWGRTYTVGEVQVYHLLSAAAITQAANAPYSWALSTDAQIQLQWPDQAEYDLYDIDYLVTDQDRPPPGAELLVRSGKHRLYRLASGGPFDLVSVPLAIAGDKDTAWYMIMSWAHGSWAQRHTHARLLLRGEDGGTLPTIRMDGALRFFPPGAATSESVFDPPGLFVQPAPPPARGSITAVSLSRHDARAKIELQEPGVVLFKATYHPGWQATLDGVQVPTMVLTPGFTGIQVPAGVHSLRLEYRAGRLKIVLLLVGVGLAIAMDRRWKMTP